MRPGPYLLLWLGAGALVFLGVFLEYQGLAYVEMAGAVALVGVVVSLAVLALGVSFLRGNGTRGGTAGGTGRRGAPVCD